MSARAPCACWTPQAESAQCLFSLGSGSRWLMSNTRIWVLGCVVLGVLACHDEPTAPVTSGTNGTSQALTRVPLMFLQVSTGYDRACGVTTDHRAYCWRVGKVNPGDYPFL